MPTPTQYQTGAADLAAPQRLPIAVADDVSALTAAIEESPPLRVASVEDARIRIREVDGVLYPLGREGRFVVQPRPLADVDALVDDLARIARHDRLVHAHFPDQEEALSGVTMKLIRHTPDEAIEVEEDGAVPVFNEEDTYDLKISNFTPAPVYISVVELGLEANVTVRLPLANADAATGVRLDAFDNLSVREHMLAHLPVADRATLLGPGLRLALNTQHGPSQEPVGGRVTLRVIVTTEPLNLDCLSQTPSKARYDGLEAWLAHHATGEGDSSAPEMPSYAVIDRHLDYGPIPVRQLLPGTGGAPMSANHVLFYTVFVGSTSGGKVAISHPTSMNALKAAHAYWYTFADTWPDSFELRPASSYTAEGSVVGYSKVTQSPKFSAGQISIDSQSTFSKTWEVTQKVGGTWQHVAWAGVIGSGEVRWFSQIKDDWFNAGTLKLTLKNLPTSGMFFRARDV